MREPKRAGEAPALGRCGIGLQSGAESGAELLCGRKKRRQIPRCAGDDGGHTAMNLDYCVGDKLDVEFAGAGAVEFSEEDGLPATESEAALLDKYRFGGADQRGFDMRI